MQGGFGKAHQLAIVSHLLRRLECIAKHPRYSQMHLSGHFRKLGENEKMFISQPKKINYMPGFVIIYIFMYLFLFER